MNWIVTRRLSAILSALCAALAVLPAPALAADLSLKIGGLRSTQGVVSICVWDRKAAFPDCGAGSPIGERSVSAADLSAPVVFEGIEPGILAVTVLHDENGNGRLDTNLLGIPKEGVALTNDRVPKFSAPRFEDAAFVFDGRTEQSLTMVYW